MSFPLPPPIQELVDELAAMKGVVAVVLGGSRAEGTHDLQSDWDLGVYYRSPLDIAALAARGTLYPPGAWGRVMNGGAWLTCGETKVDVLLRDLDVVEHWSAQAHQGFYEVDALLGYIAGVPTYLLLAERAVARLLRGTLEPIDGFPERLATTASGRWRFHARFSLDYARMHARRNDLVGTLGSAAKAVIESAHARLCEKRVWVLNEKRIVERAGLGWTREFFDGVPHEGSTLDRWVAALEAALIREECL